MKKKRNLLANANTVTEARVFLFMLADHTSIYLGAQLFKVLLAYQAH